MMQRNKAQTLNPDPKIAVSCRARDLYTCKPSPQPPTPIPVICLFNGLLVQADLIRVSTACGADTSTDSWGTSVMVSTLLQATTSIDMERKPNEYDLTTQPWVVLRCHECWFNHSWRECFKVDRTVYFDVSATGVRLVGNTLWLVSVARRWDLKRGLITRPGSLGRSFNSDISNRRSRTCHFLDS